MKNPVRIHYRNNNNSEATKKILEHSEDYDQEKENDFDSCFSRKGKKVFEHRHVHNIFGPHETPPKERKISTKINNYVLEKNPYKWGVDVLRYGLPLPKKTHRFDDNLSSNLVPNISADSHTPRKKIYYETKLDHTLCPKEEFCEKYVASIGSIVQPRSVLDSTLVPSVTPSSKTIFKTKYIPGNLNTDLVPIVEKRMPSCRVNTYCRNKQTNMIFGSCDPEPIRFQKRVKFDKNTGRDRTFIY